MDFNTFKRSCGAQGESYITIIKDWQRKAKWQWNLEILFQNISRMSNIQNGAKKSAPNCIDISGPISQISLSTPAHLLAISDAHHCTFNQWSDTCDTFPCSNSWSPHLPKGITKDLGTLLRMIALAELLRLFLISMVFRLVGSMNLPQSHGAPLLSSDINILQSSWNEPTAWWFCHPEVLYTFLPVIYRY